MTFSCIKFKKKFRIKFNISGDQESRSGEDDGATTAADDTRHSSSSSSSSSGSSSSSSSSSSSCSISPAPSKSKKNSSTNSGKNRRTCVAHSSGNLTGVVKEPSTTSAMSRSSSTTIASKTELQHQQHHVRSPLRLALFTRSKARSNEEEKIEKRLGRISTCCSGAEKNATGSYNITKGEKSMSKKESKREERERKKELEREKKKRKQEAKRAEKLSKKASKLARKKKSGAASTVSNTSSKSVPAPPTQPPPAPPSSDSTHSALVKATTPQSQPSLPPSSIASSSTSTKPPSLPSLASIPSLPSSLLSATTTSAIITTTTITNRSSLTSQRMANSSIEHITVTTHNNLNSSKLKLEKLRQIKHQQMSERLEHGDTESPALGEVYDKINMSTQVREHFYCPLTNLESSTTSNRLSHKEAVRQLTRKINSLTIMEQQSLQSGQDRSSTTRQLLSKIIKLSKSGGSDLSLGEDDKQVTSDPKPTSKRKSTLDSHKKPVNDEYNYACSQKSFSEADNKCGHVSLNKSESNNINIECYSGSSCSSDSSSSSSSSTYGDENNYYSEEEEPDVNVATGSIQQDKNRLSKSTDHSQSVGLSTKRSKSTRSDKQTARTAQPENEYDDVDSLIDEVSASKEKSSHSEPQPTTTTSLDQAKKTSGVEQEVKTTEYDMIFDANEKKKLDETSGVVDDQHDKTGLNVLVTVVNNEVPNENVNREELTMYSENSITYTAF